jgi:hypothetical protein
MMKRENSEGYFPLQQARPGSAKSSFDDAEFTSASLRRWHDAFVVVPGLSARVREAIAAEHAMGKAHVVGRNAVSPAVLAMVQPSFASLSP